MKTQSAVSSLDQERPIRLEIGGAPAIEMEMSLRRIDRREWRLWFIAAVVMIFLMLGIASFSFSRFVSEENTSFINETQAVRGLGALVLLFIGYALYQQIQINQIRRQLLEQVFAVDKVEVLAQEVYNLAVLDSLTGAYNRRYAEQRLITEIDRAQRYRLPLTVILFDLDDFKRVNDEYGHAAGDCVLKAFAERLSKSTRGSDIAARYGGDEFLTLLPECQPDDVQYVLKRLDGLKVQVGEAMRPISYSAGWADCVPGESAEELLKRVDAELYANKRSSKNPDCINSR
jgi:diguanylate cyclase (GGDEF)-like protein